MNEQTIFNYLIISGFALAAAVFILLFFINAPYGRYISKGWGITINNRIGWVIMEAAAPLVFIVLFIFGSNTNTIPMLIFLGMWEAHYVHRSFIYPWSIRSVNRQMPLIVIFFALLFNTFNAYINSRYIYTLSNGYNNEWLADPRFIIGLVIFIIGFVINRQADRILRDLREPDETVYRIPYGSLYRWISCPNYLGEIIIWFGWAVATWSLPGLVFLVWTAANLIPRARAHHLWYRRHFPDYPPERKALVPLIW